MWQNNNLISERAMLCELKRSFNHYGKPSFRLYTTPLCFVCVQLEQRKALVFSEIAPSFLKIFFVSSYKARICRFALQTLNVMISTLSDGKVTLCPNDGFGWFQALGTTAQIKDVVIDADSLIDVQLNILKHCDPAVYNLLHRGLEDGDSVKTALFCAILWYEKYRGNDGAWKMESNGTEWDKAATELLYRLFVSADFH